MPTMRTNTLTRSTLGSVLVAVAAVQQASAAGLFGRPSVLSRWGTGGVSSLVQDKELVLSQRKGLYEVRGGSTEIDAETDPEPETLYLPGLLDAVVARSLGVRHLPHSLL